MIKKNPEFQKKLLAIFWIEADEHLSAMSTSLLELEKSPPGNHCAEIIEQVYREVHSLKGAARAVDFVSAEALCQALENIFAEVKCHRLTTSPPLFDLLHQSIGALGHLVEPNTDKILSSTTAETLICSLNRVLQEPLNRLAASTKNIRSEQPLVQAALPDIAVPPLNPALKTIRIAAAKLDAVLRQVEALLSLSLASTQRAKELRSTADILGNWKQKRRPIQPVLQQIERRFAQSAGSRIRVPSPSTLSKALGYWEDEQQSIQALELNLAQLQKSADRDQRKLASICNGLLCDVREMHLLPFASLIEAFPRFTRTLARAQGKEVTLALHGGEIEIDRRILEAIKDPLLHLLRNCIDHGIETPALRARKKKPPNGIITLTISQLDSGKIEIFIADDGVGIDAAKVKTAARELHLIPTEDTLPLEPSAALALVFQSGVSTNSFVTDISGRGLGLAIVHEKVAQLDGVITLDSTPEVGTCFRITLPLTLVSLRGILVRIAEQLCVIPANNIECVMRFPHGDIRHVEAREMVASGDRTVPLIWLADVLEMPRSQKSGAPTEMVQAVLLVMGSTRIAFRVDEILGEQEILQKPLGPQLARVRNIAAACVLGNGQAVPVLNVADLIKSSVKQIPVQLAPDVAQRPPEENQPAILVVEDSITTRALLKNILETAGYRVTTAVDGVDAFTALKADIFNLVVSDVEMPRMDGFDLTTKIRADQYLKEIPVVLVTALDSQEQRKHGVDVGVSAYFVKSRFEQSNLLETVRRLI